VAGRLVRRAARVFDAVATPTGVDRYVELVRPSWSSTEVRAKVVQVARTTPRSVTLTLRPNGNWSGFQPGQYTQLSVEINGVQHTRCYSMTNAPGQGRTIELAITAHPDGLVSQHLVEQARRGQMVRLTRAQGFFTLPASEPDHLLFVSGGSGITPVMSMLRARESRGWTKPVTFVHYARSRADMIFADELEHLAGTTRGLRLCRVFTDRPGTGDHDGLLSASQLDEMAPGWREAEAFVCGPDTLMAAARTLFIETGRAAHLHTEAFTLGNVIAEAGTIPGSLHFSDSEFGVANDGAPILVQAERAGLAPQHGCRMGICHTCTRVLCSGTVRDAVTGELTSGPDAHIRICVNVPMGDIEVDL
jgi:ferredoxin-NADP reductase